jgi:hypothetical protein
MDASQTKVAQMLVKAAQFAESETIAHFTHTPMTEVDNKHAETLAKLNQSITDLGGKSAIQEGGGFSEKTEEKKTSRHEMEDWARRTNLTAASIAEEQDKPEIMDSFRMPHGSGDELLKNRINGMAKAIGDLGLEAQFAVHGLPDHIATLTDAAGHFQTAVGKQGGALGDQAGATVAIRTILKRGKSAVKTLHAIYHNVFAGDAETLGKWRTQSHVEKVASKKKSVKPPAPPIP